MRTIQMILDSEGFEPKPYPDPLTGAAPFTFGHGLTYITRKESKLIVENRAVRVMAVLNKKFSWFENLSDLRKDILVNMVFQLGLPRFLKFKKTIKYLSKELYLEASTEMLDSLWYEQMHQLDMKDGKDEENRAEWLSWMMKNDVYRERHI